MQSTCSSRLAPRSTLRTEWVKPPLILAVQQRQLDAVKLLLAKGADPDKKDTAAGYSARDYAKRDTRNREILAAIEGAGKKPTPAKKEDLDSFKLK